jgi:diaminopimelate decarboxylase
MSTCNIDRPPPQRQPGEPLPSVVAPVQALGEVVRRYGTPTYAYDVGQLRAQIAKLRAHLPPGARLLYSLKANPSLGLCGVIAASGIGADVASAGEILIALEAGFTPERIFLTGPDRSPPVLALLESLPDVTVSIDSVSELKLFAGGRQRRRALLRLRPDYQSLAVCSAGCDSRFGLLFEDLPRCREHLASGAFEVVGFHVFSGSQVLDAGAVIHHLRSAVELSLRAAEVLGVRPRVIDLGGGLGIPYGPDDCELDLPAVVAELRVLGERVAPAELVLELGRYVVATSGWYLTTVLAQQTHGGRPAVVVDGGSHQRTDVCGVGLRRKAFAPVVLPPRSAPLAATDVLGCLSLPADVLAEARPLPPLAAGDVLAFPNAGAYGLGAAAVSFHAHPVPAEVAFEGTQIELLRERQPPASVLHGQRRLREVGRSAGE